MLKKILLAVATLGGVGLHSSDSIKKDRFKKFCPVLIERHFKKNRRNVKDDDFPPQFRGG